MIDGNKERFRMSCKEEVKEDDRNKDRAEKLCDLKMKENFKQDINEYSQQAAYPVVDDPGGNQEVSSFAFVRIATSRATIERREPISQRSGEERPQKYR